MRMGCVLAAEEPVATPVFHSSLAGLTFSAPFPLSRFASTASVDVTVRAGEVPTLLPNAEVTRRRFQAIPGKWLFTAPDGSRFLAQHGTEVIFEATANSSLELLTVHLAQSVLAAVLHQRRLLPLHASSIRVKERGIGFLGRSGAGKSTLAGWFHANGQNLGAVMLGDDICPVLSGGKPQIAGGTPYLKLGPDAIRDLGLAGQSRDLPEDGLRGRRLITLTAEAPEPVLLQRLYLLAPEPECAAVSMRTLSGPEAVQALLNHTYRRQYLRGLGLWETAFKACVQVAASVLVQEVQYAPGLAGLEQLGRSILEDLRA